MRIHEKVTMLQANNEKINAELTDLMRYLASVKFQGVENNYVNAAEMYNRIQAVRSMVGYSQDEMYIPE